MKKLPVLLFLLITTIGFAQQNQRMYYGLKGGIYNGVNVFGSEKYSNNYYMGPGAGIFADFMLYKRLWLFTGVDVAYSFNMAQNKNFIPTTGTIDAPGYGSGAAILCLAYRVTGDDRWWQWYPYFGTGAVVSRYFYQYPILGFEGKCEYNERGSIATGVAFTLTGKAWGRPEVNDFLGFVNMYAKIGIGAVKKRD